MDDFARLPASERKLYFENAAASAGHMSEYIIEKDFWVCWTLKQLFTMPLLKGHLIFKGGTSLSRVFHVIERFSEDIDLSLSKNLLGLGADKDPEKAPSSKQRSKLIEDLGQSCEKFVKETLYQETGGYPHHNLIAQLSDLVTGRAGRKWPGWSSFSTLGLHEREREALAASS